MAKKVKKIDNAVLKRIQRRQRRPARKTAVKNERKRFLLVCEGQKTEPLYFENYEKDLPKGVLELEVVGTGDNTLNIVNIAIKLRDKAKNTPKEYDQVWAVFDKDDFPTQRFNNAVFKAEQENIQCAYSIEAFEL